MEVWSDFGSPKGSHLVLHKTLPMTDFLCGFDPNARMLLFSLPPTVLNTSLRLPPGCLTKAALLLQFWFFNGGLAACTTPRRSTHPPTRFRALGEVREAGASANSGGDITTRTSGGPGFTNHAQTTNPRRRIQRATN